MTDLLKLARPQESETEQTAVGKISNPPVPCLNIAEYGKKQFLNLKK